MTVLFECYADEALVRALGVPKKERRHAGDKGKVLNGVRRATSPALGLVDEDPEARQRVPDFELRGEAHGLRLLELRQDRTKRAVVLSPRLEDWLVGRAKSCGLRLADYGLPERGHDLQGIPHVERRPRFHAFLADLLAADEGMRTLKKWLAG